MTDAKVLADALVEAGRLKRWHDGAYSIECDDGRIVGDADKMTADWRVTGEVLKLMQEQGYWIELIPYEGNEREVIVHHMDYPDHESVAVAIGPLPRAINEAWYEVQNND